MSKHFGIPFNFDNQLYTYSVIKHLICDTFLNTFGFKPPLHIVFPSSAYLTKKFYSDYTCDGFEIDFSIRSQYGGSIRYTLTYYGFYEIQKK